MMEIVAEQKRRAQKYISEADHLLTMTYPLVQDPKLLLVVLDKIFLSLEYAMGSLLYLERSRKEIPPFRENFDSKFNMFKLKLVRKHGIELDYIHMITEIMELLKENEQSPMSFSRKGKFVICADDYSLKTLSPEQLKKYSEKAKLFIARLSLLVEQNG